MTEKSEAEIAGYKIELPDGRAVFAGRDADKTFWAFEFTNAEGGKTSLTLSNEGMKATIDLWKKLMNPDGTVTFLTVGWVKKKLDTVVPPEPKP